MTTAERWMWALKFCAALGCGLMAGVFFAFSSFVMGALGRLPPLQGIAAMQSINARVLSSLFMAVFMGTALACLVLAACLLRRWHQPGAMLALAGCLLYLVGTFGITASFNVPLNDALATLEPSSPHGAQRWAAYLATWTAWNHARTIAALAAAALLTLALCERGPR